jgi:hypothetical protein
VLVCGALCAASALKRDMEEAMKDLREEFAKRGRQINFE